MASSERVMRRFLAAQASEREVASTYYVDGDGQARVTFVETTHDRGSKSYKIRHNVSHYGVGMESTLPLTSKELCLWMARVLTEIAPSAMDAGDDMYRLRDPNVPVIYGSGFQSSEA